MDLTQISLWGEKSKPVETKPEKQSVDPRPDLKEDSELWEKLLESATQYGPQLTTNLHGFRCAGTRIIENNHGRLVMRPDIDPTGRVAWKSKEEYEEAKKQWLMPYKNQIEALLVHLSNQA